MFRQIAFQKRQGLIFLFVCLLFFAYLLLPFLGQVKAEDSSTPDNTPARTTAESVPVSLTVDWSHVEESQVPASIITTLVPDGVSFMAVNLVLTAEHQWQGIIQVLQGTRAVQVSVDAVAGLDYVLSGNIREGYTLTYYRQGEEPPVEATPTEEIKTPATLMIPMDTQVIQRPNSDLPAVQTNPDESLSVEEYEERQIQAALEEQGYRTPNRTFYIVGIVVCIVLIVVVVVARILLGRQID